MDDLLPDLTLAFNETFQMLSISTVLAVVGGLRRSGFLIFVTDRNLFWQNRFVYLVSSVLVNIIRSVPFVILLVLLLPLTAIFAPAIPSGRLPPPSPLSVAAIAFYARLVDSALREVDKGIIEAAEAFGASPMRIICTVLAARGQRRSATRADHHAGGA
ncbi:ABC transporter [Citrobacter koseri]|uniref:ABC transporter n=1 Tax=Citrobacter koseri TaxID=545 RepID=A0A2X2V4J5_CITKO|nr:ABC transporter [Citrobacter koseri]